MRIDLKNAELELGRRETLRVRDASGAVVTCVRGGLWITQNGDTRDIMLAPGESFRLDRAGLALVHATEPSMITIDEPRREDAPDRLVFRFPISVPLSADARISPAA